MYNLTLSDGRLLPILACLTVLLMTFGCSRSDVNGADAGGSEAFIRTSRQIVRSIQKKVGQKAHDPSCAEGIKELVEEPLRTYTSFQKKHANVLESSTEIQDFEYDESEPEMDGFGKAPVPGTIEADQ